jgi:AcrR family transcriptional regulator
VAEPLSRARIVARAVEIVEEGGVDSLSLRSLGRDLGVSAPALYDHMASKEDLLRAVADVGYDDLAQRCLSVRVTDPVETIRRNAEAYVGFALDRPGLFNLMFRYRPDAVAGPAQTEHAGATAAFNAALQPVADAVDQGLLVGHDPLKLALAIWAAVHGVATVLLLNPELSEERWLIGMVLDGLLSGDWTP